MPGTRWTAAYHFLLADRQREKLLGAGILVLAVGLVLAAWLLTGVVPALQNLGYVGLFLIGLLGAASVIALPAPTLAAVCVGGSLLGLHPVGVGLAAGAGEALGEIVGYLVGMGSQALLAKGKVYARVYQWVQKRGGLALFILALVPNPLFDLAGLAAGALRYSPGRFLLWVWAGKTLRDVAVASGCALGLARIPGFL